MLRSIASMFLALSALAPAVAAAQTDPAGAARVRTIAGTGAAGTADGPAAGATFLMPTGVAFDAEGDLFVTDAAAQNVREITESGSVRTIAGARAPVGEADFDRPGGYLDGPAASARFNHPWAIAAGTGGVLYVADRDNACIRTIRAGAVATYAGSPQRFGHQDGPLAAASFAHPSALALDRAGDLFVADDENGVRRIGRDGIVTTLAIELHGHVRSVAVGESSGTITIFASDAQGIAVYDLANKTTTRYQSAVDPEHLSNVQGGVAVGFPDAIAALGDHEFVFTDIRTNAVRYFNENALRELAGGGGYDPNNAAGGFADGTGTAARFFAPLGIAVSSTGRIVVADSGNRRLRELSPPDRRFYVLPSLLNDDQYPATPSDYAIAYVGNSLSWTDSTWSQSIAARIESDLRAAPAWAGAGRGRAVVVPYTFPGTSLADTIGFIENVPSEGRVRAVVLQLNSAFISDYGKKAVHDLATDAVWPGTLTTMLRALREELAKKHVALLVAYGPYGYELSPVESAEWQTVVPQFYWQVATDVKTIHEHAITAIRASGCANLDVWPAFARAAAAADHVPLFGTIDPHMTAAGRELFGDAVAHELLNETTTASPQS